PRVASVVGVTRILVRVAANGCTARGSTPVGLDTATRCRVRGPGPDRRLHGFLRLDSSRDRGGPAVPARQSAPAELQVGADRLSRQGLFHRRFRAALAAPGGAGEAAGGFMPDARADTKPGL